jgi:hypothetical protein
VAAFDVLLITGTPGISAALKRFPLLQALATLGGFPKLVQLLALMSLAVLVVLAPVTEGFRHQTTTQRGLLALAGMLAIVAGAGGLALLVLSPAIVITVLIIKLM